MKRLIWQNLLLAGVVASLSLTSISRPSVTLEPPWLALAFASLIAIFAGLSLPGLNVARKAGATVFLLTCFVGWLFLAPLFGGSLDGFRSPLTLSNWVGFAGISLATILGVRTRGQWRGVAWCFVGLSCLLSFYGFYAMRIHQHERLLSTFVNADCFSLYPLAGIFLSLGLYHRASPRGRLAIHGVVLFQLLALLLTGARATLAGLLVGIVMQCLLLMRRKARKGGRPVVETMAPLGIALSLLLLSSFFLLPGSSRWQRLIEGKETQGLAMRRDVLVHGGRATLSTPLFGSGPGSFALRFQEFRPVSEVPTRIHVNVAHNDYVELAVESGYPALLLWLLLGLTALEGVVSTIKRGPIGYEISGSAAALAGIATYQLLNFAIPVPADLHLIGLLLGLSVCAVEDPPRDTENPKARKLLTLSALLLVCAGLWSGFFALQGQRGYNLSKSAIALLNDLQLEEAEKTMESALRCSPKRAQWWLKLAEIRTFLAEMEPNDKIEARALEALRQAHQASPRDFAVAPAYARGLAEAGKSEEALKILKEAIKRADYYDHQRRELVTLYLRLGKILEATEVQIQCYSRNQELIKRTASLVAAAELAVPEATEKLLAKVNIPLEQIELLIRESTKRLVASQRYTEADRIQKVWGQLKGEDSCFWLERSDVWTKANKPEMELKCLERAVEDRNLSSNCYERALLRYVEVASQNGKAKTALARLTAYVERGAAGSPAYAALTKLFLQNKQMEAARRLIIAGLEQHPRSPDILLARATLSIQEGFKESAREDIQDVLEMDPKNAEAAKLQKAMRELD